MGLNEILEWNIKIIGLAKATIDENIIGGAAKCEIIFGWQ